MQHLHVDHQLLELCRQRRDGKIQSLEQRGTNPRKATHGKTWRGQRRWDAPKVKTYAYGCEGYIT